MVLRLVWNLLKKAMVLQVSVSVSEIVVGRGHA